MNIPYRFVRMKIFSANNIFSVIKKENVKQIDIKQNRTLKTDLIYLQKLTQGSKWITIKSIGVQLVEIKNIYLQSFWILSIQCLLKRIKKICKSFPNLKVAQF